MKKHVLSLCGLLLMLDQATAQTVLQRARLGHSIEDIDYAASGPHADHLLTLDGYEVWGLPVKSLGKKKEGFRKLLDLHGTLGGHTNGLAWIDSERVLATSAGAEPTTLRITASDGTPLPARTIQYLNGYVPGWVEGLAYIPESSPVFPDHLILATMDFSLADARLQVMTTSGHVVRELGLSASPAAGGIGAVTYLAPDQIAVTTFISGNPRLTEIWVVDFDGNVVRGPVRIPEADAIEGLTQLGDGRVVAVGYNSGKAHFMDASLTRRPEEDVRYDIGPGLTGAGSLAWDHDLERHLVRNRLATPTVSIPSTAIHGVPSSLDRADLVTYPPAAGFSRTRAMSYMMDEKRIVVAHNNSPQALLLYDTDGVLVEQIDLSDVGRPVAVAHLSGPGQFAVSLLETPANMISILDRDGSLVSDLDLSTAGIAAVGPMTCFDPADASGSRLLLANGTSMWVVDLSGMVVQSFDARVELGVLTVGDLSTITSGPYAGAFALTDGSNSELVVFRLD